ncbi:N-methylhydantoinase A [Persephonella hydrogeniphila]|uniref:N-methylhydantoinase A n=1 Tax=Persephonella hydrogeniphila TaxID=198703 RepID=A0A285N4J1_9AQUI|nr:hydantoinase/oxoprolinase family protein [Persephonella hydrogeniphila]SNZ03853.1 N-methylhydantoinase A [Persephonella hydrogeniphila]
MIKIGVDTGGTFTDFVFKKDGKWQILKVLSTPDDPSKAVLKGLRIIGGKNRDITHGSTVATNTVLERKGAKTAFITNEGFEDIIYIGRQERKELYNLFYKRPPNLIPEELRFGIKCRINAKGEIIQDLREEDIQLVIEKLKKHKVESVAVSFLFSFLNPEHEKIFKKRLLSEGFYVSVSHEIVPEFREYERSITTVINSYVMPKMDRYLKNIKSSISENDKFRIIQSNGGVISPETASKEPVRTVLSGPAGGVVGALTLGKKISKEKLITFDMGGTSTDVSLINREVPFSTELKISDYPLKIPVIDIHTVGAGGGSIAYLDEGGSLNVGPESAGADPGPVCYGKGENLTVTDANLYLGRLIPEYFLGGNMELDIDRVNFYFDYYSKKWRIEPLKLAEGILQIANIKMEKAIRVISVERGYDPREFSLFTFGGAGGLHASFLAENLKIPEVIVPKNPGIFSAFGMLMADVIKDYSLTVMINGNKQDLPHIEKIFEMLEKKAFDELISEGIDKNSVRLDRYMDLRYKGQSFEIVIPFSENFIEEFHKEHKRIYGYRSDKDIEIVNLRVRAVGKTEKPDIEKIEIGMEKPEEDSLISYKEVIFEGKKIKTAVYNRENLKAGNVVKGPSVIVEYSSTVVVPPLFEAYVDNYGNLILKNNDGKK